MGRTLLRDQDRRKEGIRLGRTDQHGAPGDGTHRKTRAPLHATQMDIQFGGISVKLSQTNGVRQGGPNSPVVFSALVTKLPPPPHHTSGYMDDVYVWGENPKHVQQVVDILEKIFAEHGLYVNHKKTNAIANVGTHTPGADKGTKSCLDGPRLPVSFAGGPAILAAELSTRARKAFFANRKTLCANTSLASRLKVHTAVVREAALWGAPTWPLHESLLRCANTIQLQQVRTMLKMPRRSGEDWVSWNSRTLRHARMLLHKLECPRWSTRALESIWRLWGHIGRSEDTTTRYLLWRGMHWWAAEQRKPAREGARHSGQFNSQMDTERHICNNAGSTQWWIVAHDRAAWEHMLDPFLAKHDVPWVTACYLIPYVPPTHVYVPPVALTCCHLNPNVPAQSGGVREASWC